MDKNIKNTEMNSWQVLLSIQCHTRFLSYSDVKPVNQLLNLRLNLKAVDQLVELEVESWLNIEIDVELQYAVRLNK